MIGMREEPLKNNDIGRLFYKVKMIGSLEEIPFFLLFLEEPDHAETLTRFLYIILLTFIGVRIILGAFREKKEIKKECAPSYTHLYRGCEWFSF